MGSERTGLSRRTFLAGTGAAVAATGLRTAVAAPRAASGRPARGHAAEAWQARLTIEAGGRTVVADGVALLRRGTTTPQAFATTVRAPRQGRPEYVTYTRDGVLLLRGGPVARQAATVSWGAAYRGTGDTSTTELPFRSAAGNGRLTLLAALPAADAERLSAVMSLGAALAPGRIR